MRHCDNAQLLPCDLVDHAVGKTPNYKLTQATALRYAKMWIRKKKARCPLKLVDKGTPK